MSLAPSSACSVMLRQSDSRRWFKSISEASLSWLKSKLLLMTPPLAIGADLARWIPNWLANGNDCGKEKLHWLLRLFFVSKERNETNLWRKFIKVHPVWRRESEGVGSSDAARQRRVALRRRRRRGRRGRVERRLMRQGADAETVAMLER